MPEQHRKMSAISAEALCSPQRCIKPSPNSPLRSAVERIEIADDLSSNGFVGAHDQRELALG